MPTHDHARAPTQRPQVQDVEGKLPPKVLVVVKVPMTPYQSAVYNWVQVGAAAARPCGDVMLCCAAMLCWHVCNWVQAGAAAACPCCEPACQAVGKRFTACHCGTAGCRQAGLLHASRQGKRGARQRGPHIAPCHIMHGLLPWAGSGSSIQHTSTLTHSLTRPPHCRPLGPSSSSLTTRCAKRWAATTWR